jgi:agmatinase
VCDLFLVAVLIISLFRNEDNNVLRVELGMWELWRVKTSSFAGLNYPEEESRVLIAGAPLDATNSFHPGTRFAPEYIRRVSESLELYSYLLDMPIQNKKFHDIGDLFPAGMDVKRSVEIISDFISSESILKNKKTVILGGEHTVTLGSLPLLTKNTLLIVFDAHADLRDTYLGEKYCHATVIRRISENIPSESIILIGSRAIDAEEMDYIKKHKIRLFTSRYINTYGAGQVVNRLKEELEGYTKVYLSVDIDVLDPAFAPGVGTPEPLGLDIYTLFTLLKSILESKEVIGIDIVETNPLVDKGYQTSSVAAKIILEYLAFQG